MPVTYELMVSGFRFQVSGVSAVAVQKKGRSDRKRNYHFTAQLAESAEK
jgi:hypothetical protein